MATIEIDGKKLTVDSGKMIIEAADEAGITIPRFCYHKKLSVAANCRMCLVEVDKVKKALPACATPVTDGMKVFTKSPLALAAQKAVMEFLLINHPLDCPICDQGGECELQDVSMGYGSDASDFNEEKRVVNDDNLGSLIDTEMTRCIHCTRCVRFGEEVAGMRELGATGRGEHTKIGTFVSHNMQSEISGNVIDLCPVGALTAKPSRYKARAWELQSYPSISPHDCMGSHLNVHVRRGEVVRVVPRENEEINETWLSDRDRFSYVSLNESARITKPRIKRNGTWQDVDWQTALNFTVEGLMKVNNTHGKGKIAGFCSPSQTVEEAYLMQKTLRGIGVNSLDNRLKRVDFRDSEMDGAPISKVSFASVESAKNLLIVGCNLRHELPLLAVRARKAVKNGAVAGVIGPVDYDLNFPISHKAIATLSEMPKALYQIAYELLKDKKLEGKEAALLSNAPSGDKAMAKWLANAVANQETITIISGAISNQHQQASKIRSLLALLERHVPEVNVLTLTEGANSAGCHLAGMLPDKGPGNESLEDKGLNVHDALNHKMHGFVLMGVEAEYDFANPAVTRQALLAADFVVSINTFVSATTLDCADVILPMAAFTETSGTYVNANGHWQSFKGVANPYGDSRPAWKIFRVLGNLFDLEGFDYQSSEEVLAEVYNGGLWNNQTSNGYFPENYLADEGQSTSELERIGEWPMYRVDAMSRYAKALQASGANESVVARVHPDTKLPADNGDVITVSQGEIEITLPLVKDERIAVGALYVASGVAETIDLGAPYSPIFVK